MMIQIIQKIKKKNNQNPIRNEWDFLYTYNKKEYSLTINGLYPK